MDKFTMNGVSGYHPNRKPITWIENENNCWICNSHGYGGFGYPYASYNRGKHIKISRIYWQECFGEIPKGMCVLHKCDNPACINPEHLFLGTQSENLKDMYSKGRHSIKRKLTKEQVDYIRKDLRSNRKIATEYSISHQLVSKLKTFNKEGGWLWAV